MIKLLRKIRAKLNRTFVTDCPVCHKHFYGFQQHSHQVEVKGMNYRIICHRCTKEHKCK